MRIDEHMLAWVRVEPVRTPWLKRRREARSIDFTLRDLTVEIPSRARALVRQGWTAETYRQFIRGAAQTSTALLDDGAYDGLNYHGGPWARVPDLFFEDYTGFREACARVLADWADLPFEQSTGWLTDFIVNRRIDTAGMPWWRSDETLAAPRAWQDVGDLRILAWAAGLTPAEALAQEAAGGLDADALNALVALRN